MKNICLLFAFLFSSTLMAQHWVVSEMAAMPERVSNNAVAEGFVNGVPYVYSFGGIDSTKIFSGIHLRSFRYNTQLDEWEGIPALPDTLGKIAAGASRVGDIIYIIGGYHVFSNGDEKSSDRVHRYDVNSNTYLSDGAPIPVAIDDQVQAVWRDSLIFVVTGWSDTRNVPDVQIYDPANDRWTVGTPVPNSNSYLSFGASGSIVGDTIYYFGGASNATFGPQANFRRGVINPDNPAEISWSASLPNANRRGYRMAATTVGQEVYWIGGSANTYNFDGLAYADGSGVPPANRSLRYDASRRQWDQDDSNELPMDLRGIANVTEEVKYLAGGMQANQSVSNRTFRLELNQTNSTRDVSLATRIHAYPNPSQSIVQVEIPAPLLPQTGLLIDSEGKLLQIFECHSSPLALDLGRYASGVYWLYFEVKGERVVKKVVRGGF
ncbi:MAG: hypothetical protein AAGG75_21010 [Bacteroidota bacterium]